MKWGYSGNTKAETRTLVSQVKAKEELQSYLEDAEDCDIKSIKDTHIPSQLKHKEF